MDTNEIFSKLTEMRSRIETDSEQPMSEGENALLYDVALTLGLSEEHAARLAGDTQPAIVYTMDFKCQYGNKLEIKNRDDYERLCAEAGIDPMTDRDVINNYALAYAEYHTPEWDNLGREQRCWQVIGSAYQYVLKQAAKQTPRKQRQPDYPDGRKLDCGCVVYFQSEVMSASLGSACSNCYDRMSA